MFTKIDICRYGKSCDLRWL